MSPSSVQFDFPNLPCPVENFLDHVENNPTIPIRELLQPFQAWEGTLRSVFAQDSENAIIQSNLVNMIDVYDNDNQKKALIRGRKLDIETKEERERYVMPLEQEERKADGQPAVASSLEEFRKNFNIFTENAFQSFNWSNVVVAGSAVSTTLAPVPDRYAGSVKSKREYYHEKVAPASDIDLFIYGIDDEKAALERMIAIEQDICDNLLQESITVRTKNCVTIVSRYPNRHVQIVLRLYKSISQILTGFDVNCSCVAYNGSTVFASPRALAAFMTQCNDMDLSRRSPSYESRLSKYSHRGFEVYCDFLDRSKIDPTIFERSFGRTVGLARLLVLERLPKPTDREEYIDKRRVERGGMSRRAWKKDYKNLKGDLDDEIPEWQFEEVSSSYNTFIIPYGKSYTAKKIERMFYAKDILLNAEWNENNKPPIREVKLHRHPVFLGTVAEVAQDCCGFCPTPETDEEKAVFEEENKHYVSGPMTFLKDDPGRQEIGSFHPLDANDYTDMAYISDVEALFRAIVNDDASKVKEYLSRPDVNVNCRDHCGRTPLHVAAMSSNSLETFQTLIDNGARMIARLQDGRTALHIAAARGQNDFVSALLRKSESNEEEKLEKEDNQRLSQKPKQDSPQEESSEEHLGDIDVSDSENYEGSEDFEKTSAAHSFVKIKRKETEPVDNVPEENPEDPDILDVNVLDWYLGMTPLHHAILLGSGEQEKVIETLVSSFGADALIPIKSKTYPGDQDPKLILTLTLPLTLPSKAKVTSVLKTLLQVGASCAQANSSNKATALHHSVGIDRVYKARLSGISPTEALDVIFKVDGAASRGVLNCLALNRDSLRYYYQGSHTAEATESPLMTAIELKDEAVVLKLLENGASAFATLQDYTALVPPDSNRYRYNNLTPKDTMAASIKQPLERAIRRRVDVLKPLLDAGADPSTILNETYNDRNNNGCTKRRTVLDLVQDGITKLKSSLEGFAPLRPFQEEPEVNISVCEQFPVGSYRRLYAEVQVKEYNENLKRNSQTWADQHKEQEENRANKIKAIEEAISFLQRSEEYLISRGAKSYYELYPEEKSRWIADPVYSQNTQQLGNDGTAWELKFDFSAPDLDDAKREAYTKLFDAAWSGDVETVKKLTIDAYTSNDSEPLIVTTRDRPNRYGSWYIFLIAVIRGHMDLAKAIFAIAQAQYVPGDSKEKYRYTLNDEESGIVKEVIQEASVINDITFQPKVVKSNISPLTMMKTVCCTDPLDSKVHEDALTWAIRNDKPDVVHTLLELAEAAEEDGQWKLIHPTLANPTDHSDHFCFALEQGKTSTLETFMKAVGCGIDYAALENAEQKSGIIQPEYYLGLTMNGRKRKDWAKLANPHHRMEYTAEKLLHLAAYCGSIDSVHWLLSERPLYCLQEFMRLHPENKRAKALAAQHDLAQIVEDAIGLDSAILPHLTIQGWKKGKSEALLDFWFSKYPDMLESKCINGFTPLLHAVDCNNHQALKYLIAKGADLYAINHDGQNILHIACGLVSTDTPRHDNEAATDVEKIFACLPKDLDIKRLFAHRASYNGESATIWHKFADGVTYIPGVEYLLRISGGHGLDVFNGGGNLPLHHAITKGRHRLTKLYITTRPDLLYKENAGGKTPFDLATDIFIGHLLREINEPIPSRYSNSQPDEIDQIISNNSPHLFNYSRGFNRGLFGSNSGNQGAEQTDFERDSDVTKTREILSNAVEEYPGKRTRVSLNEVNELVHRLMDKKKGTAKKRTRIRFRLSYRNDGEGDRDGPLNWSVSIEGRTVE